MNNEIEEVRLSDAKTAASLISQKTMELRMEARMLPKTAKAKIGGLMSLVKDYEQVMNLIKYRNDAYFLLKNRAEIQEKIDRRLDGYEDWSKNVPLGTIKLEAKKSHYRSLTGLPDLERNRKIIDEIIEIIKIQ